MKRIAKWIGEGRHRLNAASRHLVIGAGFAATLALGGVAWLVGGPVGTLAYAAVRYMSPSDYAATMAVIGTQQRIQAVTVFADAVGPEGSDSDRFALENSDVEGQSGPFGIGLRKWKEWQRYADARELLDQAGSTPLAAGSAMALRLREMPIAFRWCPPGTLTDGFAMMETECFQGMWTEVTGEERPWMPLRGDGLPVHSVTQSDAAMFADRLRAQLRNADALPQGWIVRLPLEAEWDYAMRANGSSEYGAGIDSRTLLDHAWIAENSGGKLHPVASRRPNAWGIHDGLGSVMEWCADIDSPQGNNPFASNRGFDHPLKWVYRGGAWGLNSRYGQLSNRQTGSDTVCGPMLGFRLVLVRDEAQPQ